MLQYFQPPGMVVGAGGPGAGGLGLEEDLRAMAGAAALEGPQLALVRQTSSVVERVSRNGLQKNVHVVVKNTPFALHLALAQPPRPSSADSPPPLSLKWLALEASLVYDSDVLKPVSFVKTKPIEYKPVINESGDQVTLNMKIKVLTSQHEDMFFRVRVAALQQKTRQPLVPPLELVSEPIKVISKPKQSKKKTQSKKRSLNELLIEAVHRIESHQRRQHRLVDHLVKRRRTILDSAPAPLLGNSSSPEGAPLTHTFPSLTSPSSSSSSSSPSAASLPGGLVSSPSFPNGGIASFSVPPALGIRHSTPPALSRSHALHLRGDDEAEAEDEEEEDEDGGDEDSVCLARSMSSDHHAHSHHQHHHGHHQGGDDPRLFTTTTTTTTSSFSPSNAGVVDELEQGLELFLAVYAKLPAEERAARIRRFMRRASAKDSECVGDFFTSAISALNPLKQIKKEPADSSLSQVCPGCACVVCPHQQELARIDQFYKDFLAIDFPLFGSS